MKYTVSAGLISGVTDTTLSPKGIVTRAQAAQILMLYMEKYNFGCNHSFTSPSCTAHGQCGKCGLKNALPLGHNVSNSFNCKSSLQSKCSRCGYWVSASAMPHKYAAATCGKPETCAYCGATRGKATGNHSWWAATCKNPKMCKVCYVTEGKKLGHNMSGEMCTRCKNKKYEIAYDEIKKHFVVYNDPDNSFLSYDYLPYDGGEATVGIKFSLAEDCLYVYHDWYYDMTDPAYSRTSKMLLKLTRGSFYAPFEYTSYFGNGTVYKGTGTLNIKEYMGSSEIGFDWVNIDYVHLQEQAFNRVLYDSVCLMNDLMYKICEWSLVDLGFYKIYYY